MSAKWCSKSTEQVDKMNVLDDHATPVFTLPYLHILYLELCRARAFVSLSLARMTDYQEQHKRLQFLQHEFTRILLNPQSFPSLATRHRFLVLCFHRDCEFQLSKALCDLLVGKELAKLKHVSCKYLTRPTYIEHSYGWENFLLPNGPGVPLGAKETEPQSAFQVLPGVGMRICSDFSREETDVISFVYGTNTASAGNLKNLPLELQNTDSMQHPHKRRDTWPTLRLRHHTQNLIMTPSPFREDLGLRLDVRNAVCSSMESYSSMLYRVEQRGPGPNTPAAALNAPNVFPVMGVRSWHRPLRRWDLHYHSDPLSSCSCQTGHTHKS